MSLSSTIRRYLLLVVVSSLISPLTWAEVLTVGIFELRPWYYRQGNQYAGILHDVMGSLALSTGKEFKVRFSPPRRMTADLIEGYTDLALSISVAGEQPVINPKGLLLGREDIFQLRLVVVSLKKNRLSVESAAELENYRVGAVRFHRKLLGKIGMTPMTFSDNVSLLKSLYAGHIDLAFSAEATLMSAAQHLGITEQLATTFVFEGASQVRLAWSEHSAMAESNRRAFDLALARMKASGEMASIISNYSNLQFFK